MTNIVLRPIHWFCSPEGDTDSYLASARAELQSLRPKDYSYCFIGQLMYGFVFYTSDTEVGEGGAK